MILELFIQTYTNKGLFWKIFFLCLIHLDNTPDLFLTSYNSQISCNDDTDNKNFWNPLCLSVLYLVNIYLNLLPGEFNIYTREAGAGGLSIAVEGPSKAELDFDDRKDGSCGVKYVVTEPGEYLVSVKFNDEHIPESPFKVYITPSIGDARKLSVAALQQKGLQVGHKNLKLNITMKMQI